MAGGECLFSGVVPVFIRTVPSISPSPGSTGWTPGWPPVQPTGQYSPSFTPYEQCRRSDSITVELLLTPSINGKRILELRLMDSIDPFFMWHMSLGEEEFFVMKREQSLLIDYGRLPYKLIELLQSCVAHGREEHPIYTCWLLVSGGTEDGRRPAEATLSITEATSLRQVPHLTFKLGAVNDATMRRHLGEMLRHYREEAEGLRTRLGGTSYAYPTMGQSSNEGVLQERVRQLEERCAMYESSRFPPTYMPSAPPSASQPRPAHVSAAEAHLSGLEQLARQREEEIRRLNDLLSSTAEQKAAAEASRNALQEELEKREAALQISKEEVGKANSIIKKLQEEVRLSKNRLRSVEALNRQHERLRSELDRAHEATRQELAQLRASQASHSADLEASRKLTKELEAKVKELEERLVEAQTVTDYLHGELGRVREEAGENTLSPEYWAKQAAAFTRLPPGEETSY